MPSTISNRVEATAAATMLGRVSRSSRSAASVNAFAPTRCMIPPHDLPVGSREPWARCRRQRRRPEVAPDQLALHLPRQIVGEALRQHQVAGLGQQDALGRSRRKDRLERVTTKFVGSQFVKILAGHQPLAVFAEVAPQLSPSGRWCALSTIAKVTSRSPSRSTTGNATPLISIMLLTAPPPIPAARAPETPGGAPCDRAPGQRLREADGAAAPR